MKKFTYQIIITLSIITMNCAIVFAADADAGYEYAQAMIFKWLARVGFLILAFGLAQIGISFASDNPETRIRGIQFAVAGAIVFSVGLAPNFIAF